MLYVAFFIFHKKLFAAFISTAKETKHTITNSNMHFTNDDDFADLKHCALTLDYNFNPFDPNKALMVWGDTSGSLVLIRFFINPNVSLFTAPPPTCINNTVTFSKILEGGLQGIYAEVCSTVHVDWVRQVRYFRSKQVRQSCEKIKSYMSNFCQFLNHSKQSNRSGEKQIF